MYQLQPKIFNLIDEIEKLAIVKNDPLKISSFTEFLDYVMGYFVSLLSFLQHIITCFR